MKYKVYEAKSTPCKICNIKESIFLPICEDEAGDTFTYPVCMDCRDKVPFKVIPVKTVLDEGFFYCPNLVIKHCPILNDDKT